MGIIGVGICDGCGKSVKDRPGLHYGKDEGSSSEYCQDCHKNEVWKQGKVCVETKIENWKKTYLERSH